MKIIKTMKTKALLAVAMFAILSLNCKAQKSEKHFGFELSGGASFATRELGGAKLNTGLGFEGILHYRFMQYLGIYAGWGWNKFSANESFAGNKTDFEETGYVFGLQFKHPIGNSPISYYLRAGGLYNHIELENEKGDIIEDSGHGLGWQLAAGIDVPLGSNWSLTPGLKFNALSREIKTSEYKKQLDLNYVMIRIGILKKF